MGCAKVRLESKEPIKLDVTMRLDIYQHVAKDVDAIEDMVGSPAPAKETAFEKTSLRWLAIEEAFAEDGDYSPETQAAIERRRARRSELERWESQGVLGENAAGFVEVRKSAEGEAQKLAEEENKDRRLIYQSVADKNGASFEETGKIFARRIQERAAPGTPIEIAGSQGGHAWTTKE